VKCTGALPSAFAIRGLPPAGRVGFATLRACDFGDLFFAARPLAADFFAIFADFLDLLLAIAFTRKF
jgi:hypothetical protein